MSGRRSTMIAALALSGALALTACGDGSAQDAAGRPTPATSVGGERGGGASAVAGQNDVDVAFAQGMIPHHVQAVEMSDMVLAKEGVDERVVALAEQIKAAQAPEIEQMTGWLHDWDADVPDMAAPGAMDHSTMGHGSGGMMSEDEMAALADADGVTASRLFLEQMIAHHRGAIEMAQTAVAEGQNQEAVELAQAVIDTQQAEIDEMDSLLGVL